MGCITVDSVGSESRLVVGRECLGKSQSNGPINLRLENSMSKLARRFAKTSICGLAVLSMFPLGVSMANAEPRPKEGTFTLEQFENGEYRVLSEDHGGGQAFAAVNRTSSAPEGGDSSVFLTEHPDSGDIAITDASLLTSESTKESGAIVSATNDYVDISWADLSGIQSYLVYKDGEPVSEVRGTSFRDELVSPGDVIDYRVEARLPRADAEGRIWGLTAVVPGGNSTSLDSMREQILAYGELLAVNKQAVIQHQTFIPQAKIDPPPVGCSYKKPYKFGGDNRGFQASGSPYKTKVQATVTFSGSGGVTTTAAKVGSTKVYNSSGKLVATKTATGTTLRASKLSASSGTSVDVRFQIAAGNPFCTSSVLKNSIEAQFVMTVTKSGSWSIRSGTHKQMPNHELYIYGSSNRWISAYRAKYANATCLVNGVCAKANMTGFYGKY